MRLLTAPTIDRSVTAASAARMKVTYYLEVISSWCSWAEPMWAELKQRYAGRAEFEWKIALMRPEDFPVSRAQCDWFYRRSGGTVMRSPHMLNSGWLQPERGGQYEAPNLMAEAARDLGVHGDEVRLALNHAGTREGRPIGDFAEAVAVAAKAGRLNPQELRARAESAVIRERVEVTTREFLSHQINQRPAFVLVDAIGDKAVFSGLVRIEPLAATIDAMLADTAAYAAHEAHHGKVPAS